MITIYILECQENRYYVGKSKDPINRIIDHFSGKGSEWTKNHKPTKIVELIDSNDDYDEDKYTIKMMEKYGIDNVRGGTFCKLNLSLEEKAVIELMIKGSTEKCYKCGLNGHYVKQCPNKNKVKQNRGEDILVTLLKLVRELLDSPQRQQNNKIHRKKCYRCGRYGHYIKNCYATYHITGTILENVNKDQIINNPLIIKHENNKKND